MPNRIIKESICFSDSIDALSWFEEVLFYRILVNCDDYGRFDGRLAVLKSRLFGLKKKLSQTAIEKGLVKLETIGLIRRYSVEDKPYLAVTGWDNHQRVRNKRSKFPGPAANCCQLTSIDVNCQSNPIQSESQSKSLSLYESQSKSEPAKAAFELFWEKYPRRVGKTRAFEEFLKVNVSLETLLQAIEQQKLSEQWQREDGRYIPNPERWLKNRCWEDELPICGIKCDGVVMSGNWDNMNKQELDAIRKLMEVD